MTDTHTASATSVGAARVVGRSEVLDAVMNLERMAQELVEARLVPGLSVAVVHRDDVVHLAGYGRKEIDDEQSRVSEDTVFQLASLSKPLAATVVAALVGDKRINWDTRIADVLPGFRLHEDYPTAEVTVRDMFAHRSGLSGNAGNDLEGLGFSRDEILGRLRHLKPKSSFRAAYNYSNFGLTAGAVAAAKAAGDTWEDAAEGRLYARLGMTFTSSRHRDFLGRADRASLHVPIDGAWKALTTRDPEPQSPAGGASSTARDLASWVRLELANGSFNGEPVVEESALAETHSPLVDRGVHPFYGVPSFYGLGWNVEYRSYGTVWGHAGAFSQGARTLVTLVPSQQLGIVVLTNAFPTGVPEGLADSLLARLLGGDTSRDWVGEWNKIYGSMFGPAIDAARAKYDTVPANASPARAAATYVGTYANDYLGKAVVAEAGGTLTLALGPALEKVFALRHFDGHVFIYRPYDETPQLPVTATFDVASANRATALTLDDLNDDGQGKLVRVDV